MLPSQGISLRKISAWAALLTTALGLRIGFAIGIPNLFHPDEIFQTLEPAHRLAFGYGVSTWEWKEGIRSWVLPTFLAGVMRFCDWFSYGAIGYRYGIIFVLSALSLTTIWFGYAWTKRVSGMEAAAIAAGACAVFGGLIYFAPKALSEVVAAHILLPGLYLGAFAEESNERMRLFFAGILCGLAASLRIQLIPAAVFAMIYFCFPRGQRKGWRRRAAFAGAGFALPVLAFGWVDSLTWSYPWQSFLRNFQLNVNAGKSLEYGSEPWYWYLLVMILLAGPMVFFMWQGARRTPFLAAMVAIIVGSHSLLGHKEVRFIYPALPLAVTLAVIGFAEFAAQHRHRFKLLASSRAVVTAGVTLFTLSSALIMVELIGWCNPPGAVLALDRLSEDSTLCGVAFYKVNWWDTGGYAHLHRNVPIIPIMARTELAAKIVEFNAMVAPLLQTGNYASFTRGDCWNGVCVYRRAGTCSKPLAADTFDGYLRRIGK